MDCSRAEGDKGGLDCFAADTLRWVQQPCTVKSKDENTYFLADASVKTLTKLDREHARKLYWISLTSLMRYKFPFSP